MRLQEITKDLLNTFAQHPNLQHGLLSDAEKELRAAQLALTVCQVVGNFGEYRETLTLYGMEKELIPLIAQLSRKVDRETKVLIKMIYKWRNPKNLSNYKDEPITQAEFNKARYHSKRKKLNARYKQICKQLIVEKDHAKINALQEQFGAIMQEMQNLLINGWELYDGCY